MSFQFNDDKIEQHLNRLRAQLSGCPDTWRNEQLTEVKTHIESLYNAQLACGLSPNDAIDSALEKIGNPEKIGKELKAQWKKNRLQAWGNRVFQALTIFACLDIVLLDKIFSVNNFSIPIVIVWRSVHFTAMFLLTILLVSDHRTRKIGTILLFGEIFFISFILVLLRYPYINHINPSTTGGLWSTMEQIDLLISNIWPMLVTGYSLYALSGRKNTAPETAK
jgi:uncharacterized membrane protein